MTPEESLNKNLIEFGVPLEGRVFLLKVWEATQFLDDVKDGHTPTNIDGGIYTLLVGLPTDDFFCQNRPLLAGCLITSYYKWQAANITESNRGPTEMLQKAYMWRASYYDLVLLVMAICFPRERVEQLAPSVMALYGESMDQYLKEFRNG